jgi:hypothetical protein
MTEVEFVSAMKDLISDYAAWIWLAVIVNGILSSGN